MPETGIEQYLQGYRFRLPGGAALGLVLWHDVKHITPSGDVAPGLGGFTVERFDERSDEDGAS